MSNHSFSLDPRTVLNVGADASPDEIRDAYHAKSKKHHPDVGGDEWAFRIVARAHEVLMSAPSSAASSRRATPDYDRASQSPDWDWTRRSPFSDPDHDLHNHNGPSETEGGGNETIRDGENADSAQRPTESARPGGNSPEELRTVDVELIWLRLGPDRRKTHRSGGAASTTPSAYACSSRGRTWYWSIVRPSLIQQGKC